MQVNSAQDYLTQVKRQIVAKMLINSPQPAHRRYNYVHISQLANGQSQFEKGAYPQTLSLAPGSVPGGRRTFSLCCDPYAAAAAAAAAVPLYAFTTFTFTPAGATGRNGPILSAAVSAYTATAPWVTNTSYFNMTTQGYQLWTAPRTGSYTVRAAGAASTASVALHGAIVERTLSLTKGQILQLVVGQMGARSAGFESSGGGGSFVASGLTPATGDCLLAAGGSGGNNFDANPPAAWTKGQSTTSGGTVALANGGAGGTDGGGGGAIYGAVAGGGGFIGNGVGGSFLPSMAGLSFRNGAVGGNATALSVGGFGGGGGAYGGGGTGSGGGGYSGGGGGGDGGGPAGGGGSFYPGGTFIGATNAGQGYIIITAV